MSLGYPLSGSHTSSALVQPNGVSGVEPANVRARPRRRSRLSTIFVVARSDGAVAIGDKGATSNGSLPEGERTPVVFRFQTAGAAEAVIAGALQRLAIERMDETRRWFLDISPGQAASAIKAEAKALSYSFSVIHPYLADGPIVGTGKRSWRRRIAGMTPYAIFTLAGALIGLVIGFALKSF